MAGDRTIVFLGPTLPLAEAQAMLPSARFCPPVRCGDVLGLLRLRPPPRCIAIIDGVFEQVGAVWHKEILQALSRGVRLYGASSMGALRAAELADLGMVGVGEIFAGYQQGRIIDDGDVAVLHASEELGYAPLTDALINIDATLQRAVTEEIIDTVLAAAILERARATFYQRRVLSDVLDAAADGGAQIEPLRAWLARPGSSVDQKRLDAVSLLRRLAQDEPTTSPPCPPLGPIPTIFLRGLQAHVACRPLSFDVDWLPPEESLQRQARLLGSRYPLLRTLALALSFVDASAKAQGSTLLALMERSEEGDEVDLAHLARLFGVFRPAGDGGLDDGVAAACALLARAWRCLAQQLIVRGVLRPLTAPEILGYAADLQRRLGLTTQERLDAWLAAGSMTDRRTYSDFLGYACQLERFLSPSAINLHGFFSIDAEQRWLHFALVVSGQADRLVERLYDPGRFVAEIGAEWRALPPDSREVLALACDFSGYAEVEQALRRM